MNETETNVGGKNVRRKEHPDGRVDTTIEVSSLQVDMKDPRNAKAKEVIERDVLPAIANQGVTVTLIHKPSNDNASFHCKRKDVRENAMRLVNVRHQVPEGSEPTNLILAEYCLVENDGKEIKVTTLV